MYAGFYNLKKEAFHITPDPEFLFLSPSHKEALGSIIYGVDRRKGFVMVTGEVGVGKTTIIRSYLEQVDKRKLKIIYIFNSNVTFPALLKTICEELGADIPAKNVYQLVNGLHEVLIEEFRKGFNVVLIIDEAQNMPVETLENLRMLSNLETSTDKLIQIVFSGQPEFEQKLGMKQLRQLRQRIAVKTTIRPLTDEESLAYIRHRLTKASAENLSIFSGGALKRIIRHARGVPRVINILCENSLITALGYRKKIVNSAIVREVISDFESGDERHLPKKIVVATVLLLILIFTLALYYHMDGPTPGFGKSSVPQPPRVDSLRAPAEKPVSPDAAVAAGTVHTSIPVATPPATEKIGTPVVKIVREKIGTPVVKIVRKGDTLSRLIAEVYGSSNTKLIRYVKENNASIDDVDIIEVGDKIIFPPREKGSGRGNE